MKGLGRLALPLVLALVWAPTTTAIIVPPPTDISGPVDDAKCDVEMVEGANAAQLHSLLMELSNSTFFRLFKVKMDDTCSFWGDKPEAECSGPDPSASTFNDWGGSSAALGSSSTPFGTKPQGGETLCSLENAADAHSFTDEVDHTMSKMEDALKQTFPENCEDDDMGTFWVDLCEEISTDTKDHVNLQLNPERYTGSNPPPPPSPCHMSVPHLNSQ
jgi:hypothetical protein